MVQPVAPAAPPSGPRRRLAALRSCRPGPAAVLAATLVLAATIVAAQTVAESFATHSLLPQGDEWVSLAVFRSVMTGRTVVADMLGQHNEHRILFPRLVLFTDYLVAGGSGRLDLVAIFVTQALTCGLFLHLLAGGATRSPGRVAVGAVVVLLLASLRQSENFTWGFQVQFVGVFAAGSLAASLFAAAIGAARAGRAAGGRTALALAVAGIATFSMSNGLLVAPVLLALAVLGRAPRRMIVAAALATVGLTVAFFDGYEVLGSGSLRAALADDPLRIPAYAAAYLGNLLDPDMGACLLLGSAGLAWAALAALAAATGRDRDPTRLALLGIMLFTAGSAALTALGRSGDGLGSAMASRYATGAACFWSAVLVHAWSSAGVLRRPRALQALVGAVGLVLVVGILKVQAPTVEVMRSLGVARTVGGDALLQGFVDDAALRAIDDDPAQVREMLPFLRERRLGVFTDPDAGRLGRPLADAGPVGALPCPGSLDVARADPALGPDGVAVGGTVRGGAARLATGRILLADAGDRVTGLGATDPGGGGWTGYATARPGADLRAFLRLASGRLCRIGTASVSPPTPRT